MLLDDVLRRETGLRGDICEIRTEFVTYRNLMGAHGAAFGRRCVEKTSEMRRDVLRRDDPRVVFDEQRRIGGDRRCPSPERVFGQRDVEVQDLVMDLVIDAIAELDQNAGIADEPHTWEGMRQIDQPRWQ